MVSSFSSGKSRKACKSVAACWQPALAGKAIRTSFLFPAARELSTTVYGCAPEASKALNCAIVRGGNGPGASGSGGGGGGRNGVSPTDWLSAGGKRRLTGGITRAGRAACAARPGGRGGTAPPEVDWLDELAGKTSVG